MNEFLAGGGDGFAALVKEHKNKLVGASDLDVLQRLPGGATPRRAAPLAPPAADRITVVK